MKTQTKIAVDRLVGLPLAWSLNLAARALGKLLRRDHSVTRENVRAVVVSKYVGMGSILQATPLIRSLRTNFPNARLIVLTSRSCRRLVERLEHVDEIVTVDDRGVFRLGWSSLRALARLNRARVDLFFDLELYSAYASIMSLLSLARNRIGFYRESAQHKRGNYTHLMYFNPRSPIRQIYLQLGLLGGCRPTRTDDLGQLRVDPKDRDEVASQLAAAGVGSKAYIVVNPNASDLMVERRWPADRFAELIDRLTTRHDLAVVLTGSPAERSYVAGVAAHTAAAPGQVANLAGSLSLGGLFALLEEARCVVTNDTGPMHMAWALRVPTVGLFGPVDPAHYGQSAPNFRVLYSPVYCSPCVHEVDIPPCMGHNVCMQRIAVESVLAAVESVLSAPRAPERSSAESSSFYLDDDGCPLGRVVRDGVAPPSPPGDLPPRADTPAFPAVAPSALSTRDEPAELPAVGVIAGDLSHRHANP